MPRYEADTDLETVKAAIAEHCIDDVCAIDNQHKLKDAFLNEQGWVPVYYLFDADGKLKTRAAGEFGVGVLTTALEKMFPPRPKHRLNREILKGNEAGSGPPLISGIANN